MTQESQTHNEDDEFMGIFLSAVGLIQLMILAGVLIAWVFTPLYAVSTPVLSVSIMPWGIVLKAPGVHQVLYAGTVRPILVPLLAYLALLVIVVFTRGTVSLTAYLSSTAVITFVNLYLIPTAGILVNSLFNTQLHELAKDPTLLARVGKIVVVNGQEAVQLPLHIARTLYFVLIILMIISIVIGLEALVDS